MKKGLSDLNCFAFDVFPRRVSMSSKRTKGTVRDIAEEWNQVLDDLHSEYRKAGGKITLILGNHALDSYLSVLRKEGCTAETLVESGAGYRVLAERSRVSHVVGHSNALFRINLR